MMNEIGISELPLNSDGSIYHLKLHPYQIADTIILVGDPGRVSIVKEFFSRIEFEVYNREFYTVTGYFNNKRITALSTGIGTDNIDIVLNELDALVNVDLQKRIVKENKKSLNLIRVGTSGAIQEDIPVDSFLISEKAIGFDGLLNFYAEWIKVCDLDFEIELIKKLNWYYRLPAPYVVNASEKLLNLFENHFKKGITISAPGFYGPQGRIIRLPIIDELINKKIQDFSFKNYKITNYEMETSALYGLAKLLGHNALTICVIIANRVSKTFSSDYKTSVKKLIELTLNILTLNEY